MQITSLGKASSARSTAGAAAKKKKTNPDDDLFASMGLSAKPKFSKPAKKTTMPVRKPAAAAAPTPSWKATSMEDNTSADWDDDGDLDDLLND